MLEPALEKKVQEVIVVVEITTMKIIAEIILVNFIKRDLIINLFYFFKQ